MAKSRGRQREAFPRLDIVEMKSAMEHLEAAVCIFNAGRRQMGELIPVEISENHIVVNYIFADKTLNSLENEVTLKTTLSPCALDSLRRVFNCPLCDSKRWSLYYDNLWACAKCLGLHYRSQLIDKSAKLHEQREALQALLAAGRPKGMHHSTHFKLMDELSILNRKAVGRPRRYASAEQNLIIRHEWRAGTEVDLWSARYWVRSGQFEKVAG